MKRWCTDVFAGTLSSDFQSGVCEIQGRRWIEKGRKARTVGCNNYPGCKMGAMFQHSFCQPFAAQR
jgi:hypothetical protein